MDLKPAVVVNETQGTGDFPFLFVQLANYVKTGRAADWPELREAQRRSLSLRNTGMAVAIDVGNPDDICGAPNCVRSACIWLTDEEEHQYLYGQRSFQFSNHAAQVQVI